MLLIRVMDNPGGHLQSWLSMLSSSGLCICTSCLPGLRLPACKCALFTSSACLFLTPFVQTDAVTQCSEPSLAHTIALRQATCPRAGSMRREQTACSVTIILSKNILEFKTLSYVPDIRMPQNPCGRCSFHSTPGRLPPSHSCSSDQAPAFLPPAADKHVTGCSHACQESSSPLLRCSPAVSSRRCRPLLTSKSSPVRCHHACSLQQAAHKCFGAITGAALQLGRLRARCGSRRRSPGAPPARQPRARGT